MIKIFTFYYYMMNRTNYIHFSFRRMLSVFQKDLMENKRKNIYRLLGGYLTLCLFFILDTLAHADTPAGLGAEAHYQKYCQGILAVVGLLWLILSGYSASLIAESMNTQEKKIAYQRLPATLGEKFVSRALYVVLSVPVAFAICLPLAEVTRITVAYLLDTPTEIKQYCLPNLLRMFIDQHQQPVTDPEGYPHALYLFTVAMGYVWVHSLFILGGTFFHKRAFFKTAGSLLGILVVLGIALSAVDLRFLGPSNRPEGLTPQVILGVASGMLGLLTAGNWWLGYYRFGKNLA